MEKGRFPPSFCFTVLYTSPEERRQTPALLKVSVDGTDADLTFNCRITQEEAGIFVCRKKEQLFLFALICTVIIVS